MATADTTAALADAQARRVGLSRLEVIKDLVSDASIALGRLRRDLAVGAVSGIAYEEIWKADLDLAEVENRLRQAGRP